ncbi:sulfatase-like hydrolase/transferase [Halorarum halobium]|uniref:sulfatase-like hydrolase/transferase n=1 Tax=Halorarum halobium TaxID=3075121 RepID=UPI0028AAC10E|nr:sulfatase-like hydrolase/transferase [Halobaculum sp. XH14]
MNSSSESPPNIVLVTLDACRFDYAREHASELRELASENVWFERAIAPSPWSLPSHASLFTGQYPHEHGCHRLDGTIDARLAVELSERGFSTYGISANGFASQRTGFHEGFDEFYYTGGRELYADGMDVSGFAQRQLDSADNSRVDVLVDTLKAIADHRRPFRSAANLLSVGIGEVATEFDVVQRIPHPIVSPDSGYCYSPERNTRRLRTVLDRHGDSPFFVFMNFMDTHRPYKPRPELQEKHLGRRLSFSEIRRLNEHVAYPWEFADELQNGSIDEEDVETVRGLYAGEVETADEQLKRVRDSLDEAGVLEDTLVVVTSDHGENLGETDERGWRRMGHEASVSDAVLHVPLLLAHPSLEQRTVSEPVSLKDLYHLFLTGTSELIGTGGSVIPGLLPFEGVTESHYPATGGQKFYERHPDVAEETIDHRVAEHSVVTYDASWKVIAESTGARWAGTAREERPYADAPDLLTETAEQHLSELRDRDGDGPMSEEDVSRLEALGYL